MVILIRWITVTLYWYRMHEKDRLRAHYKQKRRAFDTSHKAKLDAQVAAKVLAYCRAHQRFQHIHFFLPIAKLSEIEERSLDKGEIVIHLAKKDQIIAVICITDPLKEGSKIAIDRLHEMGMKVHMLTGDQEKTAAVIARELGITTFKAGMLPADKAHYIRALQSDGNKIAMVGDGINDSEALAVADLSIAMGKGTDIAMDVAKVTLLHGDLRQVPEMLLLTQKTVKTIRQNLFWAFIYNAIGIPIAAGVLYPAFGFLLNPMIAGAAMALSSVSVVTNSLRLKNG